MNAFTRLNLLRAYFSSSRNFPFSFAEVVTGTLKSPCTRIGPKYINSITHKSGYKLVDITGCATPLYWPTDLPNFDLYKVVTESFHQSDWHFYEIPETKVEPGDIVLDCGAAEGIFSLRVRERARQVFAFEPLPMFVDSMEKTFSQYPQVKIVAAALSDVESKAFLSGGSLYGVVTPDSQGVPIQVTTIDRWIEQANCQVNYIKGDLEGFEYRVLQGARHTIKTFRPKIAITVYHPGNDWQQMLAFVRSLVPEYQYKIKGLSYNNEVARPVMLHMWCK